MELRFKSVLGRFQRLKFDYHTVCSQWISFQSCLAGFLNFIYILIGFPHGSMVMDPPPANTEDTDSIPGSGRSTGEENGNPLQYSCLEKSYVHRSLVGYSPLGCKESNMTEHVSNMCKLVSCIVEKGYLLWSVHSLGRISLAFALLHFVLQSQTCLLL